MIKGIDKKYIFLLILFLAVAVIIIGDSLYKIYILNNIEHAVIMTSSNGASDTLTFDGGVFRNANIKYGFTVWKDDIPFVAVLKNGKEKVIHISPTSCMFKIEGIFGYFKMSEINAAHFKNLMNR